MPILPAHVFKTINESYQRSYNAVLYPVTPDGCCGKDDPVRNLPSLVNARAYALSESIRWGEPFIFFLLPNVISWVVPLVRGTNILGGLIGGEVLSEDESYARLETINHLSATGAPRPKAESYVNKLAAWEQKKAKDAAEFLFALTYCTLDWDASILSRNRKKALQQRQIAEEIHRRKQGVGDRNLMDEERTLLSLMKAGDQKGARRELNKTLGALFSHTADIRLLKAHVIEMMGYLVRNAVENSPNLSSLIEKNHAWMAAVIEASNFESLSHVVADSLDDFMRNIYLHGQNRTNKTVTQILDYLSENFHESIRLEMIAREVGLSTFRISHLVKEQTGKTILQHIHQLRIKEAQRLLEQSDMDCTDIAYETGFGDQSYFIKQFRKQMGITPARYRKLYYSRFENE